MYFEMVDFIDWLVNNIFARLLADKRRGTIVTKSDLVKRKANSSRRTAMKFGYENLLVWQKANDLAIAVYKETKKFPKEEIFGLTSQLRRAALSVPTNIAEGYARRNDKVFKIFLDQAYGSLVETKYLIGFSFNVGYLSKKQFEVLDNQCEEIGRLIWGFIKKITKGGMTNVENS